MLIIVVWSPAAPDVPEARLQKNPQLLWLLGPLLSFPDKSLCEAIRADKTQVKPMTDGEEGVAQLWGPASVCFFSFYLSITWIGKIRQTGW